MDTVTHLKRLIKYRIVMILGPEIIRCGFGSFTEMSKDVYIVYSVFHGIMEPLLF